MGRALAGVALLVVGCGSPPVFFCGSDTECDNAGLRGVCQAETGYCSFGDEACPSGQRYGGLAGGGFAGRCVTADAGTGGTRPRPVSETGSTQSTERSEPIGETTALLDDSAAGSTSPPPPPTTDAQTSSASTDSGVDSIEICDGEDNDGDGLVDEVSPANDECLDCRLAQYESLAIWVCRDPLGWLRAGEACAERGAELAKVTDGDLQSELAKLSEGEFFWVGANDRLSEGDWTWADGTPLAFSNWYETQPDNGLMIGVEQDCARLVHWDELSEYEGGWDDIQCAHAQRYFCTAPHD